MYLFFQDDHLWETKLSHQLYKLSKDKWMLQKYLADEVMLMNIRKKMMEDEWIRMDGKTIHHFL